MALDRRDFLKLAAGAGLSVMAPWRRATAAEASGAAVPPPFWLFFDASGGWDPTSFCDPKGAASEEEEDPVNRYLTADIGTAGNIAYAPVAGAPEFFQKHYTRTLVINGLDMATNSHTVGSRNAWSGKLSEGYPALAALIAGAAAKESPLAFVSFGGFDLTEGIVAPTRLGNLGALVNIAYPNRIEAKPDGPTFHTDATWARILAAQGRREQALLAEDLLPRARGAVSQLFTARLRTNEIKNLTEFLPKDFAQDGLQRQVQLAMASFKAGLSKTANLSIGGFDTHGDHDNQHFPRLQQLLQGIDFAWQEADRQGLADELVVVVGSDFGRTPGYNAGNGKDHWSISSMLLMGKGVPGNRVLGRTTHYHEALGVDPGTLEPKDSGGVRIQPKHVHRTLRHLAGLDDDPVATDRFPLVGADDLPLLF